MDDNNTSSSAAGTADGGDSGTGLLDNISLETTSDGINAALSEEFQLDADTSAEIKFTGSNSHKADGTSSYGLNLEESITKKYANNISTTTKQQVGVEFGDKDTRITQGSEASVKIGDDDWYTKAYAKESSFISTEKGVGTGATLGMTEKMGLFTNTTEAGATTGFDGKKVTLGGEISNTAKLGGDKNFVETNTSHSSTVGTDGSKEESTTVGGKVSVAGIEGGLQRTEGHSSSEEKNSKGETTSEETDTSKTKLSVGIPASEGVKLKQGVEAEESKTVSENDSEKTTETTKKLNFTSRIEVDPEKATAAEALIANMYNIQAGVMGAVLSEATKTTTTETEEKGGAQQEGQAQAEQQAQQEQSNEYDYYYGYY